MGIVREAAHLSQALRTYSMAVEVLSDCPESFCDSLCKNSDLSQDLRSVFSAVDLKLHFAKQKKNYAHAFMR